MSSFADALKARADEIQARETAVRVEMESADLLPACRVVLAALDRDADQVNRLVGEAPYEHAVSLLCLVVTLGTGVFGNEERLRTEVVVLAAAQEMELP
jgi:hypothetical protein